MIEKYYEEIRKTKLYGAILLIILAFIAIINLTKNLLITLLFLFLFVIAKEILETRISFLKKQIEKETQINIEKIRMNTEK